MSSVNNIAVNSRMDKRQGEEKKKKKKGLILWLLLAAVAITVVIFLLAQNSGTPTRMIAGNMLPEAGAAEAGHLPDMTDEQVLAQMQQAVDESRFSFKINAQPVFEDGGSAGTLRIENPGHNVYPFVVEIYLTETQEKIYDSGAVMPDHHIDTARLLTALPRGTHEAVAYINAYDPDTNEYQGKSAVNLSIVIKN